MEEEVCESLSSESENFILSIEPELDVIILVDGSGGKTGHWQ